jgi:hypothetical protein
MNKIERVKMVKAMEFIARQVNNENVFEHWLILGVADGDIEYGDLSVAENVEDDEAAWYVDDDKNFAELMETFLSVMRSAKKDGGLYCDGVVSRSFDGESEENRDQ